jgi:hypothetical protein
MGPLLNSLRRLSTAMHAPLRPCAIGVSESRIGGDPFAAQICEVFMRVQACMRPHAVCLLPARLCSSHSKLLSCH